MKTLKMLTGLSGPKYSLAPGDEHEFANDEADRLIEAGLGEEVTEKAEPKASPKKKAASK